MPRKPALTFAAEADIIVQVEAVEIGAQVVPARRQPGQILGVAAVPLGGARAERFQSARPRLDFPGGPRVMAAAPLRGVDRFR